jgi:hypothetical protein
VKFLHENAKYLDEAKNDEYKINYQGDESRKYDLVARMSIAFLDDMYFKDKKKLDSWYCGSVKLLAGPHRKWFLDNATSYDRKFYEFLSNRLNTVAASRPLPPLPPPATTSS